MIVHRGSHTKVTGLFCLTTYCGGSTSHATYAKQGEQRDCVDEVFAMNDLAVSNALPYGSVGVFPQGDQSDLGHEAAFPSERHSGNLRPGLLLATCLF